MPLHRLYNTTTPSANPSYLTGLLPGGAGVQVAGTQVAPGASAPRIEESSIEVFDITAPTLLTPGVTPPTPAAPGKLLVISPPDSIGGATWKLNSVARQALARGQYGIVSSAGQVGDDAPTFYSAGGPRSTGSKAIVQYDGPIQAYVETTVGGNAISAGMALSADGAGNLTAYTIPAGGLPPGQVLATALGPVAGSVSIPVLTNVFVGGY